MLAKSNQDPQSAVICMLTLTSLRMQMRRKEDMPYMYDLCHPTPSLWHTIVLLFGKDQKLLYKKEGFSQPRKREEKERKNKTGEKHLCLLRMGRWTFSIFLSQRHTFRWDFCFHLHWNRPRNILMYISNKSLLLHSVVSVFITSNLGLLSLCFSKPHDLWIWVLDVLIEFSQTYGISKSHYSWICHHESSCWTWPNS